MTIKSIQTRIKGNIYRVPTQIVFSDSLCFPCFFLVQPQIIPVPIYMICNYYIHKTDLADLSSFWKKNLQFSRQIWQYPIPLESVDLQLQQTKFPVFWQNFQIHCVFPDGIIFAIFPVFPVQWVPCIYYLTLDTYLTNLYSLVRLNCWLNCPLLVTGPLLNPPGTGRYWSPSWTTWVTLNP